MSELKVALSVVAKDLGSREISRAVSESTRQVQQSARTQQQAVVATGKAQRREHDQSRRASVVASQQQVQQARATSSSIARDSQRMHQARERLGIRSERSLQREIIQTAIAYKRLENSGRISGRELTRAADAARIKILRLQREMNELKTPAQWGKGLAAIGGGLLAGAAVAAKPLSQVMTYDRQIALMSNTAYAGDDAATRQGGQDTLKSVISGAVKTGGGTLGGAADALNDLIGSSGLTRDESYDLLPTLQKMAVGSGKESAELVPLVAALKANKIGAGAMPDALGKLLHGAQTGGYGIDNMISSLPILLAAQRDNFGISGMQGLEGALANMQGITAATNMPTESAQSLVALLNNLKNPAVATAVSKKLSIGGKGVDLAGTLGKGVQQGVDPLETLAAVIDQSAGSNKEYQRIRKRMASGGSDADKEQMATFLESSLLRDVGLSRQSMLAVSGYMQQRGSIKDLRGDYAGRGVNAIETSGAVMLDTASEKTTAASQAIDDARQRGLEPMANAWGDLSGKLSEYAGKYPDLTASVVLATDAIKVMTAAAVAFAGIKMLTGGGKGGGLVSGMAGAGAAATGRVFGGISSARAPVLASVVVGGMSAAGVAASDAPSAEKNAAYTQIAGSTGGGMAGAAMGLKAGAVAGPWGMAIGSVLGGLAGSFAGDWLGEKLGTSVFGDSPVAPGSIPPSAPGAAGPWADGYNPEALRDAIIAARQEPQKVEVDITVDGGEIVAKVRDDMSRDARRY